HLSPRFQPGMMLSDADLQEMKILLARRDQHLRRLYKNIQRLYGENNRLRLQGQLAASLDSSNESVSAAAQELHPDQARLVIQQLRSRVHELEHSTSWRITAPIRFLKRLISGQA